MAAVSVEDERVRYHARRFQEKQAEVVLRRYDLRRQHMDRAELEARLSCSLLGGCTFKGSYAESQWALGGQCVIWIFGSAA